MSNIPEAELPIDRALVQRLLGDQHPDLADLDVVEAANGWDNVMFRLGEDLVIRVPRRAMAAQLVVNEQAWLPALAPQLPLPVPAPVRVGTPTDYYPWHWSVLPWLSGEAVGVNPFTDPLQAADVLGGFLAALHQAAPDAPDNPHRGEPLVTRDEATRTRLAQLGPELSVPVQDVFRVWIDAVQAPVWIGPPLLIHGDLHPLNMLATNGELSAIIDFGDITSGDPATDLMAAWYLFDESARQQFRSAATTDIRPIDDAMWSRSRGWAVSIALTILASSADSPDLLAVANQGLKNAVATD